MRYNPPPQWPLQPGFNPPPGWTPDPSWPPAPPGWQFWVEDAPPTGGAMAQPWPPPPRSTKNRNIVIGVVAGLVVVAGAIVAIVLLALPSSPPSDSDRIRGVIHTMQTAFNNGDNNGFQSNICDKEKLPEGNFDDERQSLGTLTLDITSVSVNGDNATAAITVKSSKKSSQNHITWKFVKDAGTWKMCGKADDSSK